MDRKEHELKQELGRELDQELEQELGEETEIDPKTKRGQEIDPKKELDQKQNKALEQEQEQEQKQEKELEQNKEQLEDELERERKQEDRDKEKEETMEEEGVGETILPKDAKTLDVDAAASFWQSPSSSSFSFVASPSLSSPFSSFSTSLFPQDTTLEANIHIHKVNNHPVATNVAREAASAAVVSPSPLISFSPVSFSCSDTLDLAFSLAPPAAARAFAPPVSNFIAPPASFSLVEDLWGLDMKQRTPTEKVKEIDREEEEASNDAEVNPTKATIPEHKSQPFAPTSISSLENPSDPFAEFHSATCSMDVNSGTLLNEMPWDNERENTGDAFGSSTSFTFDGERKDQEGKDDASDEDFGDFSEALDGEQANDDFGDFEAFDSSSAAVAAAAAKSSFSTLPTLATSFQTIDPVFQEAMNLSSTHDRHKEDLLSSQTTCTFPASNASSTALDYLPSFESISSNPDEHFAFSKQLFSSMFGAVDDHDDQAANSSAESESELGLELGSKSKSKSKSKLKSNLTSFEKDHADLVLEQFFDASSKGYQNRVQESKAFFANAMSHHLEACLLDRLENHHESIVDIEKAEREYTHQAYKTSLAYQLDDAIKSEYFTSTDDLCTKFTSLLASLDQMEPSAIPDDEEYQSLQEMLGERITLFNLVKTAQEAAQSAEAKISKSMHARNKASKLFFSFSSVSASSTTASTAGINPLNNNNNNNNNNNSNNAGSFQANASNSKDDVGRSSRRDRSQSDGSLNNMNMKMNAVDVDVDVDDDEEEEEDAFTSSCTSKSHKKGEHQLTNGASHGSSSKETTSFESSDRNRMKARKDSDRTFSRRDTPAFLGNKSTSLVMNEMDVTSAELGMHDDDDVVNEGEGNHQRGARKNGLFQKLSFKLSLGKNATTRLNHLYDSHPRGEYLIQLRKNERDDAPSRSHSSSSLSSSSSSTSSSKATSKATSKTTLKSTTATVCMKLNLKDIQGGFDQVKWQCASFVYGPSAALEVAPSQILLYSYPDGNMLTSKSSKAALALLVKNGKNKVWAVELHSQAFVFPSGNDRKEKGKEKEKKDEEEEKDKEDKKKEGENE